MKSYLKYNFNFNLLKFTKDGDNLVITSKKLKNPDIVEGFFTENNRLNLVKTSERNEAHSLKNELVLNISATQNEDGTYGAVGTKYTDIITGTKFDDTIEGSTGNDFLKGGKGADTFIFNKGDGVDTILDGQNNDSIHINTNLSNLTYTRLNNNLEISYTDDDKIVISNFFKNKSSKNIDLIKNLDGETQQEYEEYINNPPVEYVYYHGFPQEIYVKKLFWSENGYELCEKSILKDAIINIGEKNKYTGTDYNEKVIATGKNGKYSLGAGKDTLEYAEANFGKSVVTVGKNENVNLIFESDIDFNYRISNNDLVLTSADGNSVTLKNYLTRRKDSTVSINGKSVLDQAKFKELLSVDAKDFKKGKYTGTVFADVIDASKYISANNKTGVTINSKSGNDTVTGSDYNDTIKVSSMSDERTTVTENGGVNTIITGDGRDTINVYGDSSNTINAGEGKNVITLSSTGTNKYTGGNGIERITVTDGTNTINAKNGYNTINVSGGKNTINGGKDYDVVTLSGGTNTLNTGDGYDKITVSGGENIINAGAGNDRIDVISGNAIIDGGEGNDSYDFMHYYNEFENNFNGHIDVIDTKGENRVLFYDRMFTEEPEVELENGNYIKLARLDGRPGVFFDVSVNKNGETIIGKDILFTMSKEFTGFNGNGIHFSDMNTISEISAVHMAALYYSNFMTSYSTYGTDPLDPEEPYYRPNYGEFSSNRYTLDVSELAQKVSAWLTSDSNTSGYKSAMEVFNNGTETQISELTAIYTSNCTDCYHSLK